MLALAVRIDVHAHLYPAEFLQGMERRGVDLTPNSGMAPGISADLDQRLEMMASAGVEMQVLSPGGNHPYLPDAAKAIECAHFANDLYKEAVELHPGQLASFGCVPLPHLDHAIREAARCLDELGFAGIALGCSVGGRPLDDPEFEPFFAELDRRNTVVFVHPVGAGTPTNESYGLPWLVGACFEDTITALRLVRSGLTSRFPGISFIVPHLGGTIPFLVSRIQMLEHAFGVGPGRLELSPEEVREGIASFYYDLTAATSEAQLGAILKLVPVSQLLMGLDFPFMPKSTFAPAIADVERYSVFSKADLRSISYGNAGRLYPALKARIEQSSEHFELIKQRSRLRK